MKGWAAASRQRLFCHSECEYSVNRVSLIRGIGSQRIGAFFGLQYGHAHIACGGEFTPGQGFKK